MIFPPQRASVTCWDSRAWGSSRCKPYLSDRWGLELEPLIHPAPSVSPTAEIGSGCIVSACCMVASEVRVDRLCWLGRGATVGHDGAIGECVFLGPGANLVSAIQIGRGANVGIGANVLEFCSLGEQCVVAGGALVRKDVEALNLVAGVPAVVKKTLEPKAFPDKPAGVS